MRAIARNQEALNRALLGPAQGAARHQEQMRRMLAAPIEQVARTQEAFARAVSEPLASLVRTQGQVRAALAGLGDLDLADVAATAPTGAVAEEAWAEEAGRWLVEWARILGALKPTREQGLVLANAIALLITVLFFLSSYTSADVPDMPEPQLPAAAVLLAAGALVFQVIGDDDPEQ